jgi:hypothetical protein
MISLVGNTAAVIYFEAIKEIYYFEIYLTRTL